MRFLRHQPLLVWSFAVAGLLIIALVGIGAQGPTPAAGTGLAAAQAPTDRGRADVDALLAHLPSVHVAIETGQAEAWSDDLARRVRDARDRYALWQGPALAAWDAVVAAVDQLAGADPDTGRGSFLALASQVDQRVFSLAQSIRAGR